MCARCVSTCRAVHLPGACECSSFSRGQRANQRFDPRRCVLETLAGHRDLPRTCRRDWQSCNAQFKMQNAKLGESILHSILHFAFYISITRAQGTPSTPETRRPRHPRRDWLDGDGHRGHDDGRPARPGSDRRGRTRQWRVHGHRHFRHGPDARPRRLRLADTRRRRRSRMPPLAAQRRVAGRDSGPTDRGAHLAPLCLARSVGTASRDSCARRAVSARSLMGRDPAALLRRVPPLPAGHASGPAGHVGPAERQPDQRAGQLDPDLRTSRRTHTRRRRLRVGDDGGADVDGGLPPGGDYARAPKRGACRAEPT